MKAPGVWYERVGRARVLRGNSYDLCSVAYRREGQLTGGWTRYVTKGYTSETRDFAKVVRMIYHSSSKTRCE